MGNHIDEPTQNADSRGTARAAHTPGPWRICGDVFGVVLAGKVEIADVAPNALPASVQRANTELIAAAPDMLEFLKLYLSGFDNGAITNTGDFDWTGKLALVARAAIRKATGE